MRIGDFADVRPVARAARTTTATPAVPRAEAFDNRAARTTLAELGTLRRTLAALGRARGSAADVASAARAGATSPPALSHAASAATLTSTEQVNAVTTSYSPRDPSFGGVSTSAPTIAGTYDGDQGDDTLTFEVSVGGVVGISGVLRVDVKDGGGSTIETVDYGGVAAGTPVTLSNGLSVAFSSGTLVSADSFEVDVSTSTPSAVSPDKPFDGTGSDHPGFEEGLSVGAGSFLVNGTSISVGASDTLDDVVAAITASAAGVTAAFDSASETVILTQKTVGATPTISVGSDSSGFLAAVKLSGASVVAGVDDDTNRAIDQVAALSGISSGTLTVNGVGIAVDVSVDSLDDVIARINASAANATASLDSSGLFVSANSAGDDLVLADGDTAFFTTLGLTPGTFQATSVDGTGFERPERVSRRLRQLDEGIGRLLDPQRPGVSDQVRSEIRAELGAAIATAFAIEFSTAASVEALTSQLGLDFDLGDDSPRLLAFRAGDFLRTQERADRFAALERLLFDGSVTSGGLIAELEAALDRAEAAAREALVTPGSLLQTAV